MNINNLFTSYKTFDQVVPLFLREKGIGIERRSLLNYTGKSTVFSAWLKDNKLSNKALNKITNDEIKEFSIYIVKNRDLDKITCKKYKEVLSAIFKYELGKKELPFDNFIIPLKKRDCSPKYIPKDKQNELLTDIYNNDKQLFLGCMILYHSGIRPGNEMLTLKVSDFDFNNGTIRISGLKAKTRKVRYADLTKEEIQYCKEYGIEFSNPELYIFGKRGTLGDKHISVNNLTHRFNYYRSKHNISKEVKFYSWKHTGGTDLITSDIANLKQLQKHFGHDRITSTEKYIEDHAGITNNSIKDNFTSVFNNK